MGRLSAGGGEARGGSWRILKGGNCPWDNAVGGPKEGWKRKLRLGVGEGVSPGDKRDSPGVRYLS